jgi:hypothetical protein
MTRTRLIFAVPALVALLAGCGGGGSDTKTVTVTQTETVTETVTAAATPEAEPDTENEEPVEATATEGAVGDTLAYADDLAGTSMDITLASLDRFGEPDDPGLAEAMLDSDSRSADEWGWAELKIRARNTGDAKLMVLGEEFQLIDRDDQRYEGTSVDQGGVFTPDAAGVALQPGDRIRGSIAVAVPRAAKIKSVRSTGLVGDGSVTWKVG